MKPIKAVFLSALIGAGALAPMQGIAQETDADARAQNIRSDERTASDLLMTSGMTDAPPSERAIRDPRIVGGGPATERGTYEFTVYLEITRGDDKFICGGALISPRIVDHPREAGKSIVDAYLPNLQAEMWVLTAAHCVANDDGVTFSEANVVAFGGHRDRTSLERAKLTVSKVVAHERYNPNKNGSLANDIALLKLKPVDLDDEKIKRMDPILMPATAFMDDLYREGTRLSVNGWGRLSESGPISDFLQTAHVPYANQSECADNYALAGATIPAGAFCAGWTNGGIDSCSGDSGGGIYLKDESSHPIANDAILAGIVSWGIGCARPKLLGVYTNVLFFMPWISRSIAANS